MKDWTAVRERYTVDEWAVRLGGLAANLARIKPFSDHPEHRNVVESLVEQTRFFIERTAPHANPEVRAELVSLQLQLALWQIHLEKIWTDPIERAALAEKAHEWTHRILAMSGLLRRHTNE